jgi:hypothetical protein
LLGEAGRHRLKDRFGYRRVGRRGRSNGSRARLRNLGRLLVAAGEELDVVTRMLEVA